jgi:hypothetical protein
MNERIAVKVFQIFQGSFDLCIPGFQLVQLVQVISHVTRCWPRRAIRYCIPISTQNGFVCTMQMKTCCREKLEGDTSGGLFQIGKPPCSVFRLESRLRQARLQKPARPAFKRCRGLVRHKRTWRLRLPRPRSGGWCSRTARTGRCSRGSDRPGQSLSAFARR